MPGSARGARAGGRVERTQARRIKGRYRSAPRDRRDAPVRRPDQYSVHLGHHRLPQGRDADAPQHPQQRVLHRRDAPLHRKGPRLHPRPLLSLLRHGPRQPRMHDARRDDGHPRRGLRPRAHHADRAAGALHFALRRADDVHRRARARSLQRVRLQHLTHRDHGRLAMSGRGDEEGEHADAHP